MNEPERPDSIVTREQYALILRRNFRKARLAAVSRMNMFSLDMFVAWGLRRFDESAPEYGPLDLNSRNWIQEQAEEAVDGMAYGCLELEKKDRGL